MRSRKPQEGQASSDVLSRVAALAPEVYLVGGAVRDRLLGCSVHDLDMVVPRGGCKLARRVADVLGGTYYPLDRERDVGRVLLDDLLIDVARFRGEDLETDLRARDYTINAMASPVCDLSHLIDPLGGRSDLEKKILRQCASNAVTSDPVRAIRAARLAVQFGLTIENATLEAIGAAVPILLTSDGNLVQPERVRDELVKLLGSPTPAAALRLLDEFRLLRVVLPQAQVANLPAVEGLTQLQHAIVLGNEEDITGPLLKGTVQALAPYRHQVRERLRLNLVDRRPLRVLLNLVALALREVGPPAAQALADWLRLSKREQNHLSRVEIAWRSVQELAPPLTRRAMHRYYREVGEAGIDGILLALAFQMGQGTITWEPWLEEVVVPLLAAFFRQHQRIVAPPPLVTGEDLMVHLGLAPGVLVGELLTQLLEEQVEGTIRTKRQALRLAKRLAREASP